MNKLFKVPLGKRIYQNFSRVKLIIIGVFAIVSIASIYFTGTLTRTLRDREREQIELYAQALEEFVQSDVSSKASVFIHKQIIMKNQSIPVILTDEDGVPISSKNVKIPKYSDEQEKVAFLTEVVKKMEREHEPIKVEIRDELDEVIGVNYVYYENSFLLRKLTYYPYIQLLVIVVLAGFVYLVFSYSKEAEQNRVWVGLAKETAHQLGTPLSSLMAWLEYLKMDSSFGKKEVIGELEKDIAKLSVITARFSNIGSPPALKKENIYEVLNEAINYLRPRVSSKVLMELHVDDPLHEVSLNRPLFEWVIENICKNAVDAMHGIGHINITVKHDTEKTVIDITDDGKGIPKSKIKHVFKPGFTSKKRGWGLGLTLAKRIIEQYHQGRVFVKHSQVDLGTTFRIVLKN